MSVAITLVVASAGSAPMHANAGPIASFTAAGTNGIEAMIPATGTKIGPMARSASWNLRPSAVRS